MKGYVFLLFFAVLVVAGCSSNTEDTVSDTTESFEEITTTDSETDVEVDTYENDETDVYLEDDTYMEESESDSPYTREELENDPYAPSTNPNDYDENGQYVPADGPSGDPADYDIEGNYRPIEDMTEAEKQAELEEMLERSLEQ